MLRIPIMGASAAVLTPVTMALWHLLARPLEG